MKLQFQISRDPCLCVSVCVMLYKYIRIEIISREIERERREGTPPPVSITRIYSLYKQERHINRERVCVCVCDVCILEIHTYRDDIKRERGRER